MDEHGNLQDWELISDSDTNSLVAIDEIIHSDYFSADSSKLLNNHVAAQDFGFSVKDSLEFDYQTEKGASYIDDNGIRSIGFEEVESSGSNFDKGGYFFVDEFNSEVGIQRIAKGYSFHDKYDEFHFGFEEIANRDPFHVDKVELETTVVEVAEFFNEESLKLEESSSKIGSEIEENHAIDPATEITTQEIQEDDSNIVFGFNQNDKTKGNSEETSVGLSNAKHVSVNNDGEKTLIWWKLPLDILRVCACRINPAWSISVAAAFIGILIVRRRLYNVKHKNRRVPLNISFEDKKAASKLLVQAGRLNVVIVRRVPIIRAPMLPASAVTPWPVIGLY